MKRVSRRHTPPNVDPPDEDKLWWINPSAGFYYDVLPVAVAADRRLTDRAKLLYAMVTGLSKKHGWCSKAQSNLGLVLGCSREAVMDDLGCLEVVGLLEKQSQRGRQNLYRPVALDQVYDQHYLAALGALNGRQWSDDQIEATAQAEQYFEGLVEEHRSICRSCLKRAREAKRRSA